MPSNKGQTEIAYKLQDSRFLSVTYTIIQNIISSEFEVRSAPWTVQLYVTICNNYMQENIHNEEKN